MLFQISFDKIEAMKLSRETLEKLKKYFSEKPEVSAAYLYGSFARDEAKKDSDIDLGVLITRSGTKRGRFDIPQVRMTEEIEQLLDKEVEVQDLESCGVEFSHRVLSEGRLVYCRDERKRMEFEEKLIRTYFDLKPFFDEYSKSISEIARKGELNVRYH